MSLFIVKKYRHEIWSFFQPGSVLYFPLKFLDWVFFKWLFILTYWAKMSRVFAFFEVNCSIVKLYDLLGHFDEKFVKKYHFLNKQFAVICPYDNCVIFVQTVWHFACWVKKKDKLKLILPYLSPHQIPHVQCYSFSQKWWNEVSPITFSWVK